MDETVRPSKRYMKHGFLLPGEYNQNIHNSIDPEENREPINQRNINYDTKPNSRYYTPEEIEIMKTEMKPAVCPICDEIINDDRCRVCQIGHKFHNLCYSDQRIETTKCPICRSENIKPCKGNYNDTFSGGKNKKQKRKTKKRKIKKTRKTKKSKNRYKNFLF
jgi:hypothetical protein